MGTVHPWQPCFDRVLMALDQGSRKAISTASICRRARVVCSESSKITAYQCFMARALRTPFFCAACTSGTNTLASPATFARTDHHTGHSEVLFDPRAQLSTSAIGLAPRGPSFAARSVILAPQHKRCTQRHGPRRRPPRDATRAPGAALAPERAGRTAGGRAAGGGRHPATARGRRGLGHGQRAGPGLGLVVVGLRRRAAPCASPAAHAGARARVVVGFGVRRRRAGTRLGVVVGRRGGNAAAPRRRGPARRARRPARARRRRRPGRGPPGPGGQARPRAYCASSHPPRDAREPRQRQLRGHGGHAGARAEPAAARGAHLPAHVEELEGEYPSIPNGG